MTALSLQYDFRHNAYTLSLVKYPVAWYIYTY